MAAGCLTVRGLRQHDKERDQRPGNDRDDDRKHGQLQRVDSFVLCQHFQGHPAERAPCSLARTTPGAVEGAVRLGLEEVVSRREGAVAPCATVVPGEPVFDSRGGGWFHIVLVG